MNVLNTRAGMIGAGVIVAGLVLYFFGQKAKQAVSAAADAVSRVNEGTPYEGAGLLGTLGNVTNRASGGFLERAGSWLGSSIFDVFNKPYDPNNPNTPALRKANTIGAVRRPEDSPTVFIK